MGTRDHLLQLTYLRTAALVIHCIGILYALFALEAKLNGVAIAMTLSALIVLNLITYLRLRSFWPVTQPELFSQLTADAVLYGFLIFQTGGGSNPFIFQLIIPLTIAAATLHWQYTTMLATLVVFIYGSLLVYYIPVIDLTSAHQHRLIDLFDLHISAMWLNFVLTVLVVTYFVVQMNRSLRRQQRTLTEERDKRIQDQQLLSLATMAAGTAHELGTPLATMQVLLKEMELEHQKDAQLGDDIRLLQQQVTVCSDKLKQMTRSVRDEQSSQKELDVVELVDEVINTWRLMRPEASHQLFIISAPPAPVLCSSTSLQQALLNLLNNATDANPNGIEVELSWDEENIWLRISDNGPGLPLARSEELGQPFVTTKGKGLGIGLFLTSTTLASYAGDVRLYNRPEGGTLTEVKLPRKQNGPETH